MGWSYEDWRGVFYEADLPAARMLERYATVFPAVELDTTFYGVPRASTLRGWASVVPSDFRFSAKAPKTITHDRRLRGASEAALDFGKLLRQEVGEKLGALLLQLPPDFSPEERAELESFLMTVASPRHGEPLPWTVEFRNEAWQGTDVVDVLNGMGVAVATTERLDLGGPLRYVRLLGTENSVARFDARQFDRSAELDSWANRLLAEPEDQPILVFARNFFEGHAPATLTELRQRLHLPTPTPPGQQQMSLF